ncbi:hypothetical protein [Massilia sp. GCM10023247]|uniref:hypothetical protein n=1 Tax=Massilia sp. GCM10023247 TaxID=3252643 RepID=UPI003617375A
MSSKSSASTQANQTQTNNTEDNRIGVAEAGSINFSGSNGNSVTDQSTTINQTIDAGAVGRSFDFAEAVTKGSASLAAASVGEMGDLSRDALGAVKDAYADSGELVQKTSLASINAITSANSKVNDVLADAYRTSKAGEQKMLAFGVVAIVGLAAAKVMGAR